MKKTITLKKASKDAIELIKMLGGKKDNSELLKQILLNNWIHEVLSACGCNQYAKAEGKEFAVYSLLYLLNKLKLMPGEKIEQYLLDTDVLLKEIIIISKEEKGWLLNMQAALAMSICMVMDYVHGCPNVVIDPTLEASALRQIIKNCSKEILFHRMYDEGFQQAFSEMLNIFEDPDHKKFFDKDEDVLRGLVLNRVCLHDIRC